MIDRQATLADLHQMAGTTVAAPRRRRWGTWVIALAFATVIAFAGYRHIILPVQTNLQLRSSLLSFGLLYESFRRDHLRTPGSLDEFQSFVSAEASGKRGTECRRAQFALDMARDGRLQVIWDLDERVADFRFYIACESGADENGGYVVRRQGVVEWMNAADFSRRMLPFPSRKAATP